MKRWRLQIVAVLLACVAPALALPGPVELAARAPASAGVVIVVEDAGAQLDTPAGAALAHAIERAGVLRDTSKAWGELAAAIDLPPDRAFDELLGRRFMLVVGASEPGRPAAWALLSETSDATQRTLRKRLSAAPRRFAGVPILAIEDARFELAIASDPGSPGRAALLLAPATASGLFDSLVPVLRGGSASPALGDAPGFEHARRARGSKILFVRREFTTLGPTSTLALAACPRSDGWDAQVRADPSALSISRAGPIEAWSTGVFDSLQDGALLAYMGLADSGKVSLPVTSLVAFPAGEKDAPDRQFMAIKRLPESVLSRLPARADREVLALTMGFEHAGLSPDPVGSLAGFLEGFGLGGRVLERVEPGVVNASSVQGSLRAKLEPLFGASPVVTWAYCGGAGERADAWGWWLLGLAPGQDADRVSGADLTAQACEAVTDRPEPRASVARRRLCVGVVRPAEIDAWLVGNAPEANLDARASGLMRLVDRLSWDLWLDDAEAVVGEIEVRIVAPLK